jgi:Na+-driven multidrug efflux pump
VATAAVFFLIVPFSIGFMGLNNVASASFNALGQPMPPLVLALSRMIVLYIPLAILGDHLFGYAGIFGATALANVINGLAAAYWNRVSIDSSVKRLQATPVSVNGP